MAETEHSELLINLSENAGPETENTENETDSKTRATGPSTQETGLLDAPCGRETENTEMETDCNTEVTSPLKDKTRLDAAFKVPSLVSTTGRSSSSKRAQDIQKSKNSISQENVPNENVESDSKPVPELPYKEPKWSGKPCYSYSLEVLKNGLIVANIDLSDRPFTVFGRLECCNVVMEHPSVSRYHAILQYREECDEEKKGFYVYDLESTHGTYLNKQQLRARTYYKMRVGHMLKLGGSSRMYILQGPEDDQEPEDELTVTELKAQKKIIEETLLKKKEEPIKEESATDGIDWGFGEDAAEDPVTENPFALSTANEELYLEDPKKTLRGWFEREGYELEYNVEEKGFGHFLCRIELPIDFMGGDAVYAEASVKGKKKEAVVAAALEACRILDRHGVLRQSQHDSHKRKEKDWESQDFYDSEEDTYLDRTGTIERKRQFRKKLVKRNDQDEVETYDSLVIKLKATENEITELENKLQEANKLNKSKSESDADQDSLEAFMANLQNVGSVGKAAKSQLNLQLSNLQKERSRLQKLVQIAQPTMLPSLQISEKKPKSEIQKSLTKKLLPMTGAMKGRSINKKGTKKTNISSTPVVKPKLFTPENEEEVEEEEEDSSDQEPKQNDSKLCEEDNKGGASSISDKSQKVEDMVTERLQSSAEPQVVTVTSTASDETVKETKVLGPDWKPGETPPEEKKKRQRKINFKKGKYDSTNPDYSMWLPPENQAGDGKTYLNEKFGY